MHSVYTVLRGIYHSEDKYVSIPIMGVYTFLSFGGKFGGKRKSLPSNGRK